MAGKSKACVIKSDAVAELVISAPPLNLFDAHTIADVESAVAEVGAMARTGEARAMILRAEGKVFCAGVDVREFQGLNTSEGARLMSRFMTLTQAIETLPIPTLAVVHGMNLTVGFELSLACDLMWAAPDVQFGLVEATVGLTPGAGGTQRLAARAGAARAAELVLTGDLYSAEEIHAWGVINRIRPQDSLLNDARALATRLANGPTVASAVAKRLIRRQRDQGVAAADAMTAIATGQIFATEDLTTGVTSLLANGPRQATFAGR